MAINPIFETLGVPPTQAKADPRVSLALLLRHLAELLTQMDEEPEQGIDGRATEPDEIRVRPRIEPLGGG